MSKAIKSKDRALTCHITIVTEDKSKRRVKKLKNGWAKVISYQRISHWASPSWKAKKARKST